VRTLLPTLDYQTYSTTWDSVANAGASTLNFDTWAGGRRYLSLVALALSSPEATQLRQVAARFSVLLDRAVDGILANTDWWSALAWPWAAIELARQEPAHPAGRASLYGRFDCLLDGEGTWQVIEYNADTPSGGREATGLEPAIARLYPHARRIDGRLERRLTATVRARLATHGRRVRLIGVVSSHSWLEDMAQAHWLGGLLARGGMPTVVGDVTDLDMVRGRITLRGRPIDALYRFYPIERLYRHWMFAGLCEAAIEGRLLLLNGLRGFIAQSKACLAWLWANRAALATTERGAVERHLPPTVLARDALASALLPSSVVKHVNGREGDSVVFGHTLDAASWESRLIEGAYVVQRAIASPAVEDVEVDDVRQEVRRVGGRCPCVGAFVVGGTFAGCYTRLDGPITSALATYAATLREET
jgi:glutathionylspermidine synthase